MVLPKNIEITPSLEEIKRRARPREIQITTLMDGPFGRMENTTIWRTQFDHEVVDFREDIVFKEGWFNTGVNIIQLMPWNVSYSHRFHIGKVGQLMFKVKRYGKYRLYGSRDIYYTGEEKNGRKVRTALYYLKFRDDEGVEDGVLLAEKRDAELWRINMVIFEGKKIEDYTIEEVTPKNARKLLRDKTGASKAIDRARENSLLLRYQLYRLLQYLDRGNEASKLFKRLSSEELRQAKAWSREAWSAVTEEEFPDIWQL